MDDPTILLPAVRASTAAFLDGFAEEDWWSDEGVRAPSMLPGWTRAHLLTHVARNADGISDTLDGALRGEVVPRYPHGPEGRNRDIEAGAGRSAAELLADLRASAGRLDRAFTAVDNDGAWTAPTELDQPAAAWVSARWREVEIHRVDLGGSYRAAAWPASFVALELPEVVAGLAERSGTALHIEVADDAVPELAGRTWAIGAADGPEPTEVRGPGWAVLAWALGRPDATGGALSAQPPLTRWR